MAKKRMAKGQKVRKEMNGEERENDERKKRRKASKRAQR